MCNEPRQVIYITSSPKHYGFLHLLFDFTMVIITSGLWLLWILIRYLRSNTR